MKSLISLFISLSLSFTALGQTSVIANVNGYTFNQGRELISFSTLVIKDGKILATGHQPLSQEFPDATLIDGQGQTLLPGIIDAHGHIIGLGKDLLSVDIRGLDSVEKTLAVVRAYGAAHRDLKWIRGRGWNQVLWKGQSYPNAAQLNEGIKDRPVWLRRVDGHAGWANDKALELAGINKQTIAPDGGEILRDHKGKATGILIDNAMELVEKHLPVSSEAYLQQALKAAGQHLLSVGITSAHDAGIDYQQYQLYQKNARQGKLPIRIYAMLSVTDPKLGTMLKAGHIRSDDDFLSIRSVKVYGDGALGSRGAALLAPYSDQHTNSGLLVTSQARLPDVFDHIIGHNFQLNYHAIGDRANRLALDHYQSTFKRLGGEQLRHRVEHTQVVALSDIPRFKQLNIIPSMQPVHATSDMNMAGDRLGPDRLKGAYAWQTFLKQGSVIAAGSDFPVELANPFHGIHAAVTRQKHNNQPEKGWIPEEAFSLQQALRAFTLDAAYSAHQEKVLGTLEPGKWADFILIDSDPFSIPQSDLWKVKVNQTWIAGEKRYEKKR